MYYYYYYEHQTFASRLKELRTSKGLTLEALAKELHGTKAAIGNLENNQKKPGLDTLIALADYFGVSLDYLVGRSDYPDVISLDQDGKPIILVERMSGPQEDM